MPLHGAWAEEEPGADLGVRQALPDQPDDLRLLSGELGARLDAALAGDLAGGAQLAGSALGEPLHAHPGEQRVRCAQLLPSVQPTTPTAQPLAVDEVGARQPAAEPGPAQPVDRLPIGALGGRSGAQ